MKNTPKKTNFLDDFDENSSDEDVGEVSKVKLDQRELDFGLDG